MAYREPNRRHLNPLGYIMAVMDRFNDSLYCIVAPINELVMPPGFSTVRSENKCGINFFPFFRKDTCNKL
jgi:hypothetical protein